MSFYQFAIGGIFANANGGNLATPNGPIQLGTIQECQIEFSQKLVSLMGQNKLPDDVAPSDQKITFKSGFGRIDVNIFNALFWGETITSGISVNVPIPGEQHTIATTVTVTNSTGFVEDGGVFYTATGQQLSRQTSSSIPVGSYTVAAGTYGFSSSEAAGKVQIYYVYTSSVGQTMTALSHLQGYGPTFEMYLAMPYQGTNGLHLHVCRASKMSAPLKRDGYVISDLEGEAYPDTSGAAFDWYQTGSNF
jgi:hypothetical protein